MKGGECGRDGGLGTACLALVDSEEHAKSGGATVRGGRYGGATASLRGRFGGRRGSGGGGLRERWASALLDLAADPSLTSAPDYYDRCSVVKSNISIYD